MKQNLARAVYLVVIVLIFSMRAIAQTGGTTTYKFLNLTQSARIAALGGNFLTIHDNDLGLALSNPSLITPQMSKTLSLNFTSYFAGTSFGHASYGFNLDKLGSFAATLQYYSFGKADNTSVFGEVNGQFNAGEYAFNLGWGRMLDSVFSIGANVKMVYSGLDVYHSFGTAVDVAGSYVPNESFCASLIFRNIGRQITTYATEGPEPLPFEIQAGVSKRLAHLPFRYSLLFQHLEKWDLSYSDPNAVVDPFTGQVPAQSDFEKFSQNAMKHIIIGGEFIPARFLSIRFGYNYLRRQEMKVVSRPGTVGFSWGIGLKVSKFNFNYSRAAYSLVGSPNFISVSTNLGDWGRK